MLKVRDPDVVQLGEMLEASGDESWWVEVGSLGKVPLKVVLSLLLSSRSIYILATIR